jgi:hypothetical protein
VPLTNGNAAFGLCGSRRGKKPCTLARQGMASFGTENFARGFRAGMREMGGPCYLGRLRSYWCHFALFVDFQER